MTPENEVARRSLYTATSHAPQPIHRTGVRMTTLADSPPPGTAPPGDTPELANARRAARHVAPTLIAEGITAQEIRELGASRPESGTMWRAVADAMDEIIAARAIPAQAAAPDREAVPA